MSKRSKRKNNLKESIILLLLLIVLLVSSTYAWFTANQTVTISTIDVTIEASNGLQISTDATKWKAILLNEDITSGAYSGNKNELPISMVPVSTVGTIDSNGFMEMYKGTVSANASNGRYELTAVKVEEQTSHFIAFDIFLKVDAPTALQLTEASYVRASENSTDKGIKQASRVAFVIQGRKEAGASVGEITSLTASEDSPLYIWEPNANLHTSAAVSHARDTYGITTSSDGNAEAISYFGIKNAITEPVELSRTAGQDTTNFAAVTPTYVTLADENGKITAPKNIFSLEAGVTKVRMYMWIEGQDIDCENAASGTDIAFNVQFSVV